MDELKKPLPRQEQGGEQMMINIVKTVAMICPVIMALVYYIRAKICEESFSKYIPVLMAYTAWDAFVYFAFSRFMINSGAV